MKIQTYTADTLTINHNKGLFYISDEKSLWKGRTLYDLYQEAYTPWEWHEELFRVAKEEGLICFSSPFDKTAVDFLESLNVPAYKIGSGDLTWRAMVEKVAAQQKPYFLACGASTMDEVVDAVNWATAINHQFGLMQCTN